MEYIKKIKILLVLLLIGVIIYAAPLSVETLAPARPLMPWQQFFLACAARLGQRDSKKAEGVEKVEAAVAELPAVGTDGGADDTVMPRSIRVVLSHNQDGNCMFGQMRISCNKSWQAGDHKYGSDDTLVMETELITEDYFQVSSDEEDAEFFLDYDGLQRQSTRYRGSLFFYPAADGFYVVNELPLETYVAYTVPGEMPASYPPEALKAQAVCSRTYAVKNMGGMEDYHADVDDSVSWQVYNWQDAEKRATDAEKATADEILLWKGKLADIYFFSTSCGLTSRKDIWNPRDEDNCLKAAYVGSGGEMPESEDAFAAYIQTDEDAILCAVKPGISQAFIPSRQNRSSDVWANSGFGLYMVSEICRKLQGLFWLASGEKFVCINSSGEQTIGDTHISGTAIRMTFSTQNLKSSRNIIQEIASLGEQQARTIRNAFKKASVPSKGLVLGAGE